MILPKPVAQWHFLNRPAPHDIKDVINKQKINARSVIVFVGEEPEWTKPHYVVKFFEKEDEASLDHPPFETEIQEKSRLVMKVL